MFSYSVALKESGLLQKIILLLFSIMPDNVTVLFKEEQNEDEWKYHVCPDTKLLEKPALNEKIIFSTEPQFQFERTQL